MQKSARHGIGVFARVSFSRAIAPWCRHHPPSSGRLDAIAGDQGLFVDVLVTTNIARMAVTENSCDVTIKEKKNRANWRRRARKNTRATNGSIIIFFEKEL
jgi:hypothetical protein